MGKFSLMDAIRKLFKSDASPKEASVGGIKKSNIFGQYLILYQINDNVPTLKRRLTSTINHLIDNSESFKIGKTGNPQIGGQKYLDHEYMYSLCVSKDKNFIDELEAYYNEKFIGHAKNNNKSTGSAEIMESPDGKFYFYVVIS